MSIRDSGNTPTGEKAGVRVGIIVRGVDGVYKRGGRASFHQVPSKGGFVVHELDGKTWVCEVSNVLYLANTNPLAAFVFVVPFDLYENFPGPGAELQFGE